MKTPFLYALFAIFVMAFVAFKPAGDLQLDWKHITDKDYIVSYIKVQYDSSSQYAIDTKVKIYNTNEGARLLSKKSVKLLRDLMLNPANFGDERVEDICKSDYIRNAIIVMRNGEVDGIINIGCDEKTWYFEPVSTHGSSAVLNQKGLKIKDELFKSIR
ncbi:MAG: hypothetical protein V4580_12075 [Bacteroidota bacterium]